MCPPSMTASGKRVRRVYTSKEDARREGGRLRRVWAEGVRGSMISQALAVDARRAMEVLEGTGVSLVEAARMAREAMGSAEARELFGARWDRVTREMEMEWSDRYARDMGHLRSRMPPWTLAMPCGAMTRERMEEALREMGTVARSTMDMRVRMLSAMLGHRERSRRAGRPVVLDLDGAERVMAACGSAAERWTVAMLLWAGIRPDGEIRRMDWADVGNMEIYVPATAAKTKTDRIIPITPRLARELVGRPAEGVMTPPDWKRAWARIRKTGGISGIQDVTRHTFASHFLAAFGEDSAKNAMGHAAGSRTLFRHYRRAVAEESGKSFFQ